MIFSYSKWYSREKVVHREKVFCFDLSSLPRFEIPLALICNLCPDFKSLPQFVIFLPQFEIPKAAPICHPSSIICSPQKLPWFVISLWPRFVIQKIFSHFFVFSHFGTRISTWITWFRDPNMMKLGLRHRCYDT